MAETLEPYCWICDAVGDDVKNCDMCRQDAPGQLDLFGVG